MLAVPSDIYNACFGEHTRRSEFPTLSILRNSGAFENWPVSNLAYLCRMISKCTKSSGELIYQEGQSAKEFYILLRGEVVLLQLPVNVGNGEGSYLVKIPQCKPKLYQCVRVYN
jgi:hypothetical protein